MTLIALLLLLDIPEVESYLRSHIGYSTLIDLMFVIPGIPAAIYAKNKFNQSGD